MKKYLFLILLLNLLSACRKENEITPAVSLTEKWQPLSDKMIYISDRNIVSSYSDDRNLYLMTPYTFYSFDSSMKGPTPFSGNSPDFSSYYLRTAIGKYFRAYNMQSRDMIEIADNVDHSNSSRTTIRLDMLVPDKKGYLNAFSTPDDSSVFYLGYTKGLGSPQLDSQEVFINKYKIERDFFTKANLVWSKSIFPKGWYSLSVDYLGSIDNVLYASVGKLSFRIVDGVITDTIRNDIKKVVKIGSTLYANCKFTYQQEPHMEWPDGLIASTDNGRSWSYIGYGGSFSWGTLTAFNGELFLYSPDWVLHIDRVKGKMNELNLNGINGPVHTLNIFQNRAYIGTDAGVFVKSYKHFLRDK